MSDDTPTQRFDAAGDAPTELFDASSPAASPGVVEERGSRKLVTILATVGGALLIAVLIVLILLLNKSNATPGALPAPSPSPSASASPTPSVTPTKSATPTPTPTPTRTPTPTPTPTATAAPPAPPSTDAKITNFSATHTVLCNSSDQSGIEPSLDFSWSSKNAIAAYFGVGTDDAQSGGMGWTLPPSGNQHNFPSGYDPFYYPCPTASVTYTLTVVGTGGSKASQKVTVTNNGDTK
jgi:hypothetical protein